MDVAIYERISLDQTGEAQGVKNQRSDLLAWAEREGHNIVAQLTDNDISAAAKNGKVRHRPGYAELLNLIRAGAVELVVSTAQDRLLRSSRQLEDLLELAAELHGQGSRVPDLLFVNEGGRLNLGDPNTVAMARIRTAVSGLEVDVKRKRLEDWSRNRARRGRPPMGGRRPYGWDRVPYDHTHANGSVVKRHRLVVNTAEAANIRRIVERVISGESVTSIVRWLNDEGITTSSGAPWQNVTVTRLVQNPLLIGKVKHKGKVFDGDGSWEPILDEATFDRAGRAIAARKGKPRPPARDYWLRPLVVCGKCDQPLWGNRTAFNGESHPEYRCAPGGGRHYGDRCGGVSQLAEPLEEHVQQQLLARIHVAGGVPPTAKGDEVDTSALDAVKAEREELDADLEAGRVTASSYARALDYLDQREQAAKVALAEVEAYVDPLTPRLLPDLERDWPELNAEQRRIVLNEWVHRVVVEPVGRGGNANVTRSVGDRVTIEWRRR